MRKLFIVCGLLASLASLSAAQAIGFCRRGPSFTDADVKMLLATQPMTQHKSIIRMGIDPRFTLVGVNTWYPDIIANTCRRNNINWYCVFAYNNSGSTGIPAWPGVTDNYATMSDSATQQRFASWVWDTYARYQDVMDHVEILNEQDGQWFAHNPDPAAYTAVVKAVYTEYLKRKASFTKQPSIVAGVFSNYDDNRGRTYAQACFRDGLLNYVNKISYHDYDDVYSIRTRLANLIHDEIEIGGKVVPTVLSEANYWPGRWHETTESGLEANQVTHWRVLLQSTKGLVNMLIGYQLTDSQNDTNFGFWNLAGSPKPVVDVVHKWIN